MSPKPPSPLNQVVVAHLLVLKRCGRRTPTHPLVPCQQRPSFSLTILFKFPSLYHYSPLRDTLARGLLKVALLCVLIPVTKYHLDFSTPARRGQQPNQRSQKDGASKPLDPRLSPPPGLSDGLTSFAFSVFLVQRKAPRSMRIEVSKLSPCASHSSAPKR